MVDKEQKCKEKEVNPFLTIESLFDAKETKQGEVDLLGAHPLKQAKMYFPVNIRSSILCNQGEEEEKPEIKGNDE